MMNKSKGKFSGLKIYTAIVSVLLVFTLIVFAIVFHHAGYDTRLLVKLGLKEQQKQTNWAVVAWNNTLEKMNYDADIVFFGDSITCGSDFRNYFPNKKIVNLGYPGDSLSGMLDRVSAVSAVTPEQVFVLGGINGLTDSNTDECIATYGKLLDELSSSVPNAQIFVLSVLPISEKKEETCCHNTTIRAFNEALETIALDREMIYVNINSEYDVDGHMNPELTKDGIHLFPEAYEKWANVIEPYIE